MLKYNELNNTASEEKCGTEMMKLFVPILDRSRFVFK